MVETEQAPYVREIDDVIGRVEQLYRAVTGRDVPAADAPYAPIPAEKDPTEHVERQLDRLLEALGGGTGAESGTSSPRSWIPAMSVWESEKEIRICVDLPGVTRDQVQVVADGKLLTITGTRPQAAADSFRLHSSEKPFGRFRRVVFVPSALRDAEPRAEMKDGVLDIRIPKEPGARGTRRKVAVN